MGEGGAAEIGEYQVERAATAQQDVFRFQVAVDELAGMYGADGVGQLFQAVAPGRGRQRALFAQQVAQRTGAAVLHQFEGETVGDAPVEHADAVARVDGGDAFLHLAIGMDAVPVNLGDQFLARAVERRDNEQFGFRAGGGQGAHDAETGAQGAG